MEYITLGEKTFVKANKIARDLGYTSDYIGQLCRGGKVNAKLVGRTWYVEESSIKEHKKNRYRSVKAVGQKDLRYQVQIHTETEAKAPQQKTSVEPKYSKHRNSTLVTPRYTKDDADLLPVLLKREPSSEEVAEDRPKKGSLKVGLADAEQVAVKSETEKIKFEASELPEVRFKGQLKVASADEVTEEPEIEPGEVVEAQTEDAHIEVEEHVDELVMPVDDEQETASADAVMVEVEDENKKDSYAVEIRNLKEERDKRRSSHGKEYLPVREVEGSIDTIVPISNAPERVTTVDEKIDIEQGGGGYVWWTTLACLVCFSALGLFALSLTEQTIVDDTSITKGYILNIHDTVFQLYVLIQRFLG